MMNTITKPSGINVQLWNPLTQTQKEAAVDLIVRAMYADSHIALPESDLLEQLSENLEWNAVISFDGFVRAAISNTSREKSNPERREKFFKAMRMRLGDPGSRRVIYDLCCDFMRVDGEKSLRETAFLNLIKSELEITGRVR